MDSPLTLQARPIFTPKIVSLYESLFKEAYAGERSEGFWTEFFLLKCHPPGVVDILRPLSSDNLMHLQPQTRELFRRAVNAVRAGASPSDEIALDTLNVFLQEILSKRYTNSSSDIILLLAGLDNIDGIFTDFVVALDQHIKTGRTVEVRYKAVQVALCAAAGSFQTGLLSYFTHRDIFPGLMKFINEQQNLEFTFEAFTLLGVLANYNKFELQNPYQARLGDFVNENAMKKMIAGIGFIASKLRDDYVAIQDDIPENWTFNTVLTYVGLAKPSAAKPKTPPAATDARKLSFSTLPGQQAAIFLAAYDFVHANKLFAYNLVNYNELGSIESSFCAYLSLTSYLLQHAHRSPRATSYSRLNLLVLRILLEDHSVCKQLASEENQRPVRLCRQRQPHLPLVRDSRVLITAIFDTIVSGINHNLRKKLDVDLYILCVRILHRSISFLIRSRIRLAYHWSELWRSILSLIKFLASHHADLVLSQHANVLNDELVNLIALSLSSGDSFLPGASDYDDLFYKLVETGDTLVKFRDIYELSQRPTNSISTLISVSEHYYRLISENQSKQRSKNLSPQQVSQLIKNGYETLSIQSKDGLDSWDKYREVDEKGFLKKVARMTVRDIRELTGAAL